MFIIHNDTDNYFVKAELNKDEGIYYVTDHVSKEADATHFIPVTSGEADGKVIVKGLEDDEYTITEVRTADGYTLLKEDIKVVHFISNSLMLMVFSFRGGGWLLKSFLSRFPRV